MRFHPVNALLDLSVPYFVAAALGVGTGAIAATASIVAIVTLFAHADVHVPGRWLDRVVVTPRYHRTHHELGELATNVALVLPLLDALFGTRARPRPHDLSRHEVDHGRHWARRLPASPS
jgi:sterol desaturase/sphingolipid hydroxylase (fatty acid hydroxylase superfamily)